MHLTAEALTLHLQSPFRIAYGTSTERTNVLVRLGDGIGEGAVPPYYDVTVEECLAYLEALDCEHLLADDYVSLESAVDRLPPGPAPAMAAVDMALHDHWARQLGHPLYRLWGLNPMSAPPTSYTLCLTDDEDLLREQVRAAAGYPCLKLKLGSDNLDADEAPVAIAAEETDAALCVDANSGWSVDEALKVIPRLVRYELLFVEQPIPHGDHHAWHQLRRELPTDAPLLFADESVQRPGDVLALRGAVDGINVKVSKAGGLRAARYLIWMAHMLDMEILLGCMIESAVAVTAAAHLSPLADYADLDGFLHVADDPYAGLVIEDGRLCLSDTPGLGVTERTEQGAAVSG